MKIKLISFAVAAVVIAIVCYSFTTLTNSYNSIKNIPYNQLSVKDQSIVQNTLIAKLKKDSVFMLYNEISNIEREGLSEIYVPGDNNKLKSSKQLSSLSKLSAYYQALGIKNPDKYAKLEALKLVCLAYIAKNYPQFKSIDQETRIKIFKTAKRPLRPEEIVRRRAKQQKAFELYRLNVKSRKNSEK